MNRVLLASIRAHSGRLIATGLAVTLSIAFVVTTLLLSSSYTKTMTEGLTAQLENADLQIAMTDENAEAFLVDSQIAAALEGMRGLDEVAAADVEQSSFVQVVVDERRANARVESLLSEENRWQELVLGRWPDARGEAIIDESSAKTLALEVGDTFRVRGLGGEDSSSELTIVGLSSSANVGFSHGIPTVVTSQDTFHSLGLPIASTGILLSAAEGVSSESLATTVEQRVEIGSTLSVFTREEAVAHQVAQLSGSSTLITSVMLLFGAIALLVSGFVIANTFRVLVAQRTGELALLRCIGANRTHIYRLILLEAGLVGLVFSVVGAAAGVGVAAAFVKMSDSGASVLPLSAFSLPPLLVVGAIGCGTVVTMLFALGPARNATRVRPIAALRPVDAVSFTRGSKAAAIVGPVLALVGGVGLVFAAVQGSFAAAIAGGAAAAIGVLITASVVLPTLTGLVGRLVAPLSAPTQLAVANIHRSKRHTAATGSALLIGGILLAMLTTGVMSARESVIAQIDDRRPFDLIAEIAPGEPIDPVTVEAVTNVSGVVASAEVLTGAVDLVDDEGVLQSAVAEGVDREATNHVAHSPVSVPKTGQVHVSPEDPAARFDGRQVGFRGAGGEVSLVVVADEKVFPGIVQVASSELVAVSPDAGVARLQLRLEAGLNSADIQSAMTTILSFDERIEVHGGAQERAFYNQILDTMLMVVLALLAVAVIIAFVGIGNTAALSVIERRRESALLRAVGLGRGQLVGMICTEAALIAIVSTLIGLVIGVLFGWAGVITLGKAASEIEMALYIPWGQLAAILLGAAIAGVLAAALPAYAASRRHPVEDLAAV